MLRLKMYPFNIHLFLANPLTFYVFFRIIQRVLLYFLANSFFLADIGENINILMDSPIPGQKRKLQVMKSSDPHSGRTDTLSIHVQRRNILFRLLNIWFGFITILFLSSYFPHWQNTTYHGWINESLYSLLFLLSVSIAKRDRHNKDIFINLSVLFLAYSLSFINIFLGKAYLLGSDYTAYLFLTYKRIVLCFLFNYSILYIPIKYMLYREKSWKVYMTTSFIIIPVFLSIFSPYLFESDHIFYLGEQFENDFYTRLFLLHIPSLLSFVLYALLLYRNDNVMGTHINLLMTFFFVFFIASMIEMVSRAFAIQIYSISQIILSMNLIFISIAFFKHLFFLRTVFGQFYENLLREGNGSNSVRVVRYRSGKNVFLLKVLKIYLIQRRYYLLSLAFVTGVAFSIFRMPVFFTIHFLGFSLSFIILFLFINALYKKRKGNEYLLPQ